MSKIRNISPNTDCSLEALPQDEEEDRATIPLLSMTQDQNSTSIVIIPSDDTTNNRNNSNRFPRRFRVHRVLLSAQAALSPCLYRTGDDSKETFSLQGKYNFTLVSFMILSLIISIIAGVTSHNSTDKSAYPLSLIFGALSILCFLGMVIVAGLRKMVPKKVLAAVSTAAASTAAASTAAASTAAASSVAPSAAQAAMEEVFSIHTVISSMRRKIKEIKEEVKDFLINRKEVEGYILVEEALEIVLQHNKLFLEKCSLLDKDPSLFFWRASRQQLSTAIEKLENLMHRSSGIQRLESKSYDFRLRNISHTRVGTGWNSSAIYEAFQVNALSSSTHNKGKPVG